jgi:hypothetical protein
VNELSEDCSYSFTIQTSIVCVAPTVSVPTSNCSWAGIDFSPLTGHDLYGTVANTYVMNLCGVVTSSGCTGMNSAGSMICQQYDASNPNNSVSVSAYNPSAMPWSYTNGRDLTGGIQVITETGSAYSCGSASLNRTAIIQFMCGPTVVPQQLPAASGYPFSPYQGNSLGVIEDVSCTYSFIIFTSLVCTSAQLAGWTQTTAGVSLTAANTGFVGLGYSFASLTTQDVQAVAQSGNWYVMHLGGVVQNSLCQVSYIPGSQTSMVHTEQLHTGSAYCRRTARSDCRFLWLCLSVCLLSSTDLSAVSVSAHQLPSDSRLRREHVESCAEQLVVHQRSGQQSGSAAGSAGRQRVVLQRGRAGQDRHHSVRVRRFSAQRQLRLLCH